MTRAATSIRRKRRSGVTLLEIMIAIALMAIGLLAVVQVFPIGFLTAAKSIYKAQELQLAKRKLEENMARGVPTNTAAGLAATGVPSGSTTSTTGSTTSTFIPTFVAFDAPNQNFFYKTDVVPVVDPLQKYVFSNPLMPVSVAIPGPVGEWTNDPELGATTAFEVPGSLWRIIVTVEGPLSNPLDVSNHTVTTILGTYVGVHSLGVTTLTGYVDPTTGTPTLFTTAGQQTPQKTSTIIVGNVDGFTVFEHTSLVTAELQDTGGGSVVSNSNGQAIDSYTGQTTANPLVSQGANEIGLDNIVIDPNTSLVRETNKIIRTIPFGPVDVQAHTIPGEITLLNPLMNLHNNGVAIQYLVRVFTPPASLGL